VQRAVELVGQLAQPSQPVRRLCRTASGSDLHDVQLGACTGSQPGAAAQQVVAPGAAADGDDQPLPVHALIVTPAVTRTTRLNATLTPRHLLRASGPADDGVVMETVGMVTGVVAMVLGVLGVLAGVARTFGPASRTVGGPMALVAAGACLLLVGRWLTL
jgi:hypothetical protein